MPYFWEAGRGRAIYFLQANSEGNRGAIFKRGKPFAGRRLRRRVPIFLLGLTIFALASADALPAAGHKQVSAHASKTSKAESHKDRPLTEAKRVATHPSKASKAEGQKRRSGNEAKQMERAPGPRTILATDSIGPVSAPQLSPDLVTLKQAIRLVQQHKLSDATKLAASIEDPAEQKLLEWALLRDPDNLADFDQYNRFIQANPNWPSIPLLRRRAEARLWQERRDAVTVRRFIGTRPASAVGRLAIARLLLDEGDRAGASREVRAVWHSAELSAELETVIANTFGDGLTPADDIVRMDRRIGAKDFAAAMRAAKRLGSAQVAIVKACEQAEANGAKSGALLETVPKEAQADLGYALCRLHWLLAHDDVAAAVKLVTDASGDDLRHQDTDEWWRERRTLARRLLDLGDPNTAYRVVREAAAPANPYYRAEFHFMPGWIALRFLSDPITALRHFDKVDEGSSDPIVLARAAYWRGRAFEAADQPDEMRT